MDAPHIPTTLLLASSSAMAALPEAGRAASVAALGTLLDSRRGPESVVLGPGLDVAAVVELVQRYRVWRPEVSFVLERHHLTATEVDVARGAGVQDVVVVGDLGGLAEAVARAAGPGVAEVRPPAAETPRGQVTTVLSTKGGAGVTTLAVNLAAALADGGRRSVVLVDLDLALGDVAASLSLTPGPSIVDAVAGGVDGLTVAGLHRLLVPHSAGLTALLAPPQPERAASVQAPLVGRAIDLLARSFDHVVVDTPTVLDASVLVATAASDRVLHVVTPDVPSVRHLVRTLDTLGRLGQPEQAWRVVLNRADAKVGLPLPEVERLLGRAVTGRVPSSVDVPTSVNQGVPLVLRQPGHPVSRAVAAVASRDVLRGRRPEVVDLRDVWPAPMRDRPKAVVAQSAGAPRPDGPPASH